MAEAVSSHSPALRDRARIVHQQAFVVDAHADTFAIDVVAGKRRLADTGKGGHVDLARLAAGGVSCQVFTLFVPPTVPPAWNTLRALEILDAVAQEVGALEDKLLWVHRGADLDRARQEGRIAILVTLEGCEVLGGSLATLRAFYRLGVRAAGLTWNVRNELADGVGEPRGAGLTGFGREVVAEMNNLGMVVDVSHLSEAGFWEVLEISRQPVIASHSNARRLCDHRRNLTDDQIRALARKGGVIGINFCPEFLTDRGPATLQDVVRHIEYMIELAGPDHVGLGSDFDGIPSTPSGLEDVSQLPRLTEALLAAGLGEETVQKVLGHNFLRVFREVLR